ncbi:26S proteasome regulatory subunit 10B homolog A-like [Glycine soja]|uniref:26S proteasome regulatory subunit 10B homolog A-like n=1 Tax=Glycine soja TaxID=3848 RepID=UPI00103AC66A|nr:26S proteasome regulatory subunit 10B homolog A-like [Glycine soja]
MDEILRRLSAVAEYRRKFYLCQIIHYRIRAAKRVLRDAKKEYATTQSLRRGGQLVTLVEGPYNDHNQRFIVKSSSGADRHIVGIHSKVEKEKLVPGTRVSLDRTTMTIMRILPPQVDPFVYNMLHEDPINVKYAAVGGLSDQIRQLRESIELPLTNPELFLRVGIGMKLPKGVLLYGPPGTGKTLLAKAISCNVDAKFLKVVSSTIIHKSIGESARLIREMFKYARNHQPCIIFMDEIDAIAGRRSSNRKGSDREIQRTLKELLNQLDGLNHLEKVKIIMATNRLDVLDPALLRHGRIDRKIEITLPNRKSRMEIFKIHAEGVTKRGEIDYEAVVKLAEGFNGADLRNVCTEAGLFAIRAERDYVIHGDFIKGVRKLNEAKKLESSP